MNFKKIADTSFKEESKLLPKGFTQRVLHILFYTYCFTHTDLHILFYTYCFTHTDETIG